MPTCLPADAVQVLDPGICAGLVLIHGHNSFLQLHELSNNGRLDGVPWIKDPVHVTSMAAFWVVGGGTVWLPTSVGWPQDTLDIASDSTVIAIVDQYVWTVPVADLTQCLVGAHLMFELEGPALVGWGQMAFTLERYACPESHQGSQ